MKPPKIIYSFWQTELAPETLKELSKYWMREDYRTRWLCKTSILDNISCGDYYPGITVELDADGNLDETAPIPERWWVLMGFSREMRAWMEVVWETDPETEVEWKQ